MLLHRVTEHVREQNWTAIAIDFVIVVLGVAAATVAIEPTVGADALGADRNGAIAALILLGITLLVALLAPDVDRVDERREYLS